MFKCFEESVDYNVNNVVFTIPDDLSDAWKSAFERRFGAPTDLKDEVGCQYKTQQLEIPKETSKKFGTFSASVWINPKDGNSKVMLQGQAYMTFLTFVIPDILEEIKPDVVTPKPVTDRENTFKNPTAVDEGTTNEAGVQILVTSFQKLETEVLKLRDNLVAIVDTSVNTLKDSFDLDAVNKKLDKLEETVESNKTELVKLNNKIDQVIVLQEQAKPVNSEDLNDFLESSKTVFTALNDITTIQMDPGSAASILEAVKKAQLDNQTVQDFRNDSKDMLVKIEQVSEATKVIKEDIGKLEKNQNSINLSKR